MRKRHLTALSAVAVLAGAGGLVYADPFTDPGGPTAPDTTGQTITLPTGDRVRLVAGGGLRPVDHFNHYSAPRPDGDRVIIPLSALDEVRSGDTDPRLFNVDALLRHGYHDARDVTSPEELGHRGLVTETADSDANVTVSYTWTDGSVPDNAGGIWVNRDTGRTTPFAATDGVATAALEPGDYTLIADMGDAEHTTAIGTVADFTVDDEPVALTVDGGRAEETGIAVAGVDTERYYDEISYFADTPEHPTTAVSYTVDDTVTMMAIPTAEPEGHESGLYLRSERIGAAGAADADTYSLFDVEPHGIPADPSFTAGPDELAEREMVYDGLGGKGELERFNLSYHPVYHPGEHTVTVPVTVPSKRTEYYSTVEGLEWTFQGSFTNPDGSADDVLRAAGRLRPGPATESWLSAPVSQGADPGHHNYGAGSYREPLDDDTHVLNVSTVPFDSADPAETIYSHQLPGEATLSKDGEVVARGNTGGGVYADIPADDAGWYTFESQATRDASWTPLGTRAHTKWTFHSEPVTEAADLPLSVVTFDASGVVGGYAEAGRPQDVTLEFSTQPDAADRDCAEMTFEVSYDDGDTWTSVPIDRDGDRATARLTPEADASFVSVRFTATDDAGQAVEHSAIRSYGLK